MGLYRDEGIVLRTYRLGEADRIVVLLTRDHGKVRAVAKGVRKTKSRFGGRLEPLGTVSLLLYRGRELDIITQAEALDSFPLLRADLARMTDAMALLEAVDHVAQEREANPELYRMLRAALRTVSAPHLSPLLVGAFYWKLLALEGVGPVLDRCVSCERSCESESDPVALDPLLGGVLCRTCRPAPGVWRARPEAVELVRRILGGGLGAALAEPPSAATAEVSALAVGWMEHHLERQLRAVRALHG